MRRLWNLVLGSVLLLLLLVGSFLALAYRWPLWFFDRQTRWHLWRAGVQSREVQVDGYRIHYLEAVPPGNDTHQPLLLVHGLGARAEDWSPLIPGLAAAGFHVIVPDLLGYGTSAHPDIHYSISAEEKIVLDFANAVGVSHADVAGWSMGGWISMKLAADRPEFVRRLILFDAAGVYFPGYPEITPVFNVKDTAGVHRLFAVLTPQPPPLPEFVAKAIARRIQGNFWVVRRTLASMVGGHDLMDFRLQEIRQPTLVVWGKLDALVPLSAGAKIHRGIQGSSLLIVNGCGHLTPAQCPHVSLRAMVTFLQAQPPITNQVKTVNCGP